MLRLGRTRDWQEITYSLLLLSTYRRKSRTGCFGFMRPAWLVRTAPMQRFQITESCHNAIQNRTTLILSLDQRLASPPNQIHSTSGIRLSSEAAPALHRVVQFVLIDESPVLIIIYGSLGPQSSGPAAILQRRGVFNISPTSPTTHHKCGRLGLEDINN